MHTPTTLKLRACLRMRVTCCVDKDGNPGLLLALRDTTGMLQDDLTACWIGADALEFMHQHLRELVPGRCLDLELHHLHAHFGAELRARVQACALAPLPPSWSKHAARNTHLTTTHLTTTHPEPIAS